MVLYTIYPIETIMRTEEPRKYLSVDFQGKFVVLELRDGEARVERLVSLDPTDYLNPDLQPGAKVQLSLRRLG